MRIFKKLALGLLLLGAASITGATSVMAQSQMYGSYNSFYQDLAPYGRWVNNRNFGEVWVPDVARGFRPYVTGGHWAMTEYGNTWVSDYEWGWAPFHYGRWTFDDYYGWIWVPGKEWAPAWVSWRNDNDYYGWAPLAPSIDINIRIDLPLSRWVFVPKRYITSTYIYHYCLPPDRAVYVYRNTTLINNIYVNGRSRYSAGPYKEDIERNTRQRVNVYRIENENRPSRTTERNGSLRVYRPNVDGGSPSESRDSREGNYTYNDGSNRPDRTRRENEVDRPGYGNPNNSRQDNHYERGGERTQNERNSRQHYNPSNSSDRGSSSPSNAPANPGNTDRRYDRPGRSSIPPSGNNGDQQNIRSNPPSAGSETNRSSSESSGGRSRPSRG